MKLDSKEIETCERYVGLHSVCMAFNFNAWLVVAVWCHFDTSRRFIRNRDRADLRVKQLSHGNWPRRSICRFFFFYFLSSFYFRLQAFLNEFDSFTCWLLIIWNGQKKTFFFSKLMRNFTLNGWRLAVVVAVYIHLAIFIFRVYNSICGLVNRPWYHQRIIYIQYRAIVSLTCQIYMTLNVKQQSKC